jgi:hypothetical protein
MSHGLGQQKITMQQIILHSELFSNKNSLELHCEIRGSHAKEEIKMLLILFLLALPRHPVGNQEVVHVLVPLPS